MELREGGREEIKERAGKARNQGLEEMAKNAGHFTRGKYTKTLNVHGLNMYPAFLPFPCIISQILQRDEENDILS